MARLIFVGDVVGEPGLAFLETHLPRLIEDHGVDFVVVNAENIALTAGDPAPGNAGMTRDLMTRLFALPVDLVTGGNHSWDGPDGHAIHDDERILRPLNYGERAPGRGAAIVEQNGTRLGVINVASRTALPLADEPLDVVETQLAAWAGRTDLVLVDFHGESVNEKMSCAFAFDGRVAAVVGTHTHVPTLDAQLLPQGTAYVTDVGMTGPGGGIQGYAPAFFVQHRRTRLPGGDAPFGLAEGDVQLGAVLIESEGGVATRIERLSV